MVIPYDREVGFLKWFMGILHLNGYDHHSIGKDEKIMIEKQKKANFKNANLRKD